MPNKKKSTPPPAPRAAPKKGKAKKIVPPTAGATRQKKPNFREFNLNCSVRVKLNERGYQHMADLDNEIMGRFGESKTAADYKARADADGYSGFQLWSFMQDFGPVTSIGGPNYFDLTVLFEERDLTPFPLESPKGSGSVATRPKDSSPKASPKPKSPRGRKAAK